MEKPVHRVQLRPVFGRSFPSSEAFLETFGRGIDGDTLFLPMPEPASLGESIRFHFQLSSGREILAGEGIVVAVRTGANGETPGCVLRFSDLGERSRRNLEMIRAWRAAHSA